MENDTVGRFLGGGTQCISLQRRRRLTSLVSNYSLIAAETGITKCISFAYTAVLHRGLRRPN